MIDGPKALLTILTFDATTGWQDVQEAGKPELDLSGIDRLKSALDTTVKTVIIERQYIDKDYRDTFSNFHSKRFSTPNSRCLRLHFFSQAITREDLKSAEKVQPAYLGYSVIRPTRPNCIGRTLISPKSQVTTTGTMSLCAENVTIQGTALSIKGFPFISQDCDVTVCAQSALWMLIRYFSNRYPLYPESYPFQVGNLTKDYSIGRIYPSSGLYVWQIAEALRRLNFAPLIYSRNSFPDFDHLLYTYIESGIPVLAGFHDHVVAAFGHKSEYVIPAAPPALAPGQFAFSSSLNTAFIINDDNRNPYQILASNTITIPTTTPACALSKYKFDDIETFIAPLAEKIFLPAEAFQTAVAAILNSSTFGFESLSPILKAKPLFLRLLLTTSKSFKKRLTERKMGHPTVEDLYRNLPLPHFIWICEISHSELYVQKHEILGEIIWDATRNAYEPNGWMALHYPELLVFDYGSALNGSQQLQKIDLQNGKSYPLFRSNLTEIAP